MHLDVLFHTNIEFILNFNDRVIPVNSYDRHIRISYTPDYSLRYRLSFECDNLAVIKNPIQVNKFIFDDFWCVQGKKIAFGKNIYFDSYLQYASQHNLVIDHNVFNNDLLCFTGKLEFSFTHPIYKFLDETLR
jgi:hypothetical protein